MAIRILRALAAARRATSAIEFAIVAPILVLLATGTVGLSEVIRAQTDLTTAAQTMAQLIATQTLVTTAQISDFCTGSLDEMVPYSTTGLKISVASVTRGATSGTVGLDWHNESCGSGAALTSATTLAASVVPSNGDSTIVVQATYTFHNPLSLVLPATFSLTETAFARPRANTTVTYN